jgi:hypothetical protein
MILSVCNSNNYSKRYNGKKNLRPNENGHVGAEMRYRNDRYARGDERASLRFSET